MPLSKKPFFIYLASQSPRRSEILKTLKLPFRTVPSSYKEILPSKARPSRLAIRHAKGKALLATLPPLKHTQEELVLGADTIVYFQGKILGKPRNYKEAERVLLTMSGKSHRVYTGIALVDRKTSRVFTGYAVTKVRFKRWQKRQIQSYVKAIHALDKAGSYAIQMKPRIVLRYQGSLTNVIGLPKEKLLKLLMEVRREKIRNR